MVPLTNFSIKFRKESSKAFSLYFRVGTRCTYVAWKGNGCNLHLVENSSAPQLLWEFFLAKQKMEGS